MFSRRQQHVNKRYSEGKSLLIWTENPESQCPRSAPWPPRAPRPSWRPPRGRSSTRWCSPRRRGTKSCRRWDWDHALGIRVSNEPGFWKARDYELTEVQDRAHELLDIKDWAWTSSRAWPEGLDIRAILPKQHSIFCWIARFPAFASSPSPTAASSRAWHC